MYQIGSISTPGTCIQGKLLRYVRDIDDFQTVVPQAERVLTQCGVPSILPGFDGGLDLFVAGQADHPNSPACAPWPLSPLCVHFPPQDGAPELTRLPDKVDGIQRFVSGIPSAVVAGQSTLVYFNGGQLLEYQRTPGTGWSVSAIPVPEIVVDANPVAAVAAGSVHVVSAPRGETLLLCRRHLQSTAWRFLDLGAPSSVASCAGDPAVTEFAGKLHIFVCVAAQGRPGSVQDAFELWDFVVDLDGFAFEAFSVSAATASPHGGMPPRVIGTPALVRSHHRLQVFVRSDAGRLLEFRSTNGRQWESLPVSQTKVGGDPGAILLGDQGPLVFSNDGLGCLTEFREIAGFWQERSVSHLSGEAERWPRPVMRGEQLQIFDLDIAV